MKKLIFAMLAFGLVVVSCKSSSGSVKDNTKMEQLKRPMLGMWESMKWTSETKFVSENAALKVNVPAEKNTVVLECTNYNRFWLASIMNKGLATADRFSVKGEYYEVKCDGNKLIVSFAENRGEQRNLDIQVQGGDIFCSMHFIQKAR